MSEVTEEQLEHTVRGQPTPSERRRSSPSAERERRAAALAEVVTFGDPVLRSRASEVTEFGPELAAEAERMVAIMRDAMGVGLAATQLGALRRLLVFQAGPDARATAIVNPRIEWLSDELATAEEGCLSLPGIGVDVERAAARAGARASTSTASRCCSRPRGSRRACSSTRSTTSTGS